MGRLFLALMAGAALGLGAFVLPAASRTTCEDKLVTTSAGMTTTYCGPARGQFTLGKRKYAVRGGTCAVDRKKHTFSVVVGWALDPWPGKPFKALVMSIDVAAYQGPGSYPLAGGKTFLRIGVTPFLWMTWADRQSQREGAPKAWALGTVKLTAKGGRFAVPVETAPGGVDDFQTKLSGYVSRFAAGSFTC
jgi:hypothetical protein